SNNATIFTVTLDTGAATPSYTVAMTGVIDVKTQIDFSGGNYNFTGGNNAWNGFVPTNEALGTPGIVIDNNSPDLLLTPAENHLPASSINTTATIGGVGNTAVGSTETFRLDFVTDLRGDTSGGADYSVAGNRDHVFDGHYTVNG